MRKWGESLWYSGAYGKGSIYNVGARPLWASAEDGMKGDEIEPRAASSDRTRSCSCSVSMGLEEILVASKDCMLSKFQALIQREMLRLVGAMNNNGICICPTIRNSNQHTWMLRILKSQHPGAVRKTNQSLESWSRKMLRKLKSKQTQRNPAAVLPCPHGYFWI
jgi:hypothetical protein